MAQSELDIINGSDVLVHVNVGTSQAPSWKPAAHQTSCSITNSSDVKERVTKNTGLWKGKKIVGLSVQIKCDALASKDADCGYDKLQELWLAAEPVLLKYGALEETGTKYYQGLFVISSLEKNDPAQDDSTMSITFDNSGEVTSNTVTVEG